MRNSDGVRQPLQGGFVSTPDGILGDMVSPARDAGGDPPDMHVGRTQHDEHKANVKIPLNLPSASVLWIAGSTRSFVNKALACGGRSVQFRQRLAASGHRCRCRLCRVDAPRNDIRVYKAPWQIERIVDGGFSRVIGAAENCADGLSRGVTDHAALLPQRTHLRSGVPGFRPGTPK